MKSFISKRKIETGIGIGVLIFGLLLAVFPGRAEAIPAFARSINAPCVVCHTAFPKLNSFGFEYKQRGYRMPGQSHEGKYLWEQPVPLAGRIDLSAVYETDRWSPQITGIAGGPNLVNQKRSRFALDDWQLLAGGTLAPRISFLGIIAGKLPGMENGTAGSGADDASKTDLHTERFIVQIDDLIPNAGLNLRIGKDQIDNYFLSSTRRLTRADYLIQIQPSLGASLRSTSVGAEANGFIPIGLRYAAGLRNFSPAYASSAESRQRIGAYYAWVNQSLRNQTASLIVASDRVGDAGLGTDAPTLGYGVSFNFYLFGSVNIVPGLFWYQEGADAHGGRKMEVVSGTLELIYPFPENLWGTFRYDFHDRKEIDAEARQVVASLAWYPFWNVRWVAEVSRLTATNLFPVGSPAELLSDTGAAASDLTRTAAALMLQVDF
jgi:hypothetical protein